mmetsp:Transcript_23308/g.68869  ORF Transcript_23308/g.68869 Transcript_23308/m.68869 type:complete len:250 (-) Transcript_23308:840-1589(-)
MQMIQGAWRLPPLPSRINQRAQTGASSPTSPLAERTFARPTCSGVWGTSASPPPRRRSLMDKTTTLPRASLHPSTRREIDCWDPSRGSTSTAATKARRTTRPLTRVSTAPAPRPSARPPYWGPSSPWTRTRRPSATWVPSTPTMPCSSTPKKSSKSTGALEKATTKRRARPKISSAPSKTPIVKPGGTTRPATTVPPSKPTRICSGGTRDPTARMSSRLLRASFTIWVSFASAWGSSTTRRSTPRRPWP